MKKILSLLIVMFLAISVTACSGSKVNTVEPSVVNEKMEKKESFILVASSTTCTYCKQYEPIVKEFAEKMPDVDVLKVEIDQIKETDQKANFIDKFVITGTPTTVMVNKGEVKMTKAGVVTESQLEEYANKYLK